MQSVKYKFPYICPRSGAFHGSDGVYKAYAVVYGHYYVDVVDVAYSDRFTIHGLCDCCNMSIEDARSAHNLFNRYLSLFSFCRLYGMGMYVFMPPMQINGVSAAISSKEVPLFVSLDNKIVAAYVVDYLLSRIAYKLKHGFDNPDVVSIVNAVAYDCLRNVDAEEDAVVASTDEVLLRSKGTFYSMSNIRKMTRVTWQEFVQIISEHVVEGGNK
jgi:hypothetical protein